MYTIKKTVKVYFSHKLYLDGMDPTVCNEVVFWFSFMMLGIEYLLFFTLMSWFLTEMLVFKRIASVNIENLDNDQDVTFNSD